MIALLRVRSDSLPIGLGQAEVGDLGRAVGGHRILAGLRSRWTIPSRWASAIARARISTRLGGPLRQPGRAVEPLVQAAAGQVLQLEERQAAGLADGVDLDDVRVLELGDRLGLAEEAGDGLGRGVRAGQDHLERARAIEPDLPGLVDDAHAAAAQLARIS